MKNKSNPERLFEEAIFKLSKGEVLSAHEALRQARKFYMHVEALA